jgi:hypothetical protein
MAGRKRRGDRGGRLCDLKNGDMLKLRSGSKWQCADVHLNWNTNALRLGRRLWGARIYISQSSRTGIRRGMLGPTLWSFNSSLRDRGGARAQHGPTVDTPGLVVRVGLLTFPAGNHVCHTVTGEMPLRAAPTEDSLLSACRKTLLKEGCL